MLNVSRGAAGATKTIAIIANAIKTKGGEKQNKIQLKSGKTWNCE